VGVLETHKIRYGFALRLNTAFHQKGINERTVLVTSRLYERAEADWNNAAAKKWEYL